MSPLQVEILLWYYARACDFRDGDFSAPAVREEIDYFRGMGAYLKLNEVREHTDYRTYVLTEKGIDAARRILGAHDPVPMRLRCPGCGALHLDEGEFATKPHHTHACQQCGEVWRPAVVATVGVQFLPGFKNQ